MPMRIVSSFDELEHGYTGLGLSAESAPFQELALECGKKAVAVANGSQIGTRSALSHP